MQKTCLYRLKLLFFKPGRLACDFNRGKRHVYVAPLKFYLFISFIFFFLLPMGSLKKKETVPGAGETKGFSAHRRNRSPLWSSRTQGDEHYLARMPQAHPWPPGAGAATNQHGHTFDIVLSGKERVQHPGDNTQGP